jgi:predicted dehydrogenase
MTAHSARWAIVGTGTIARTTVADLQLTENVDLVAVASRSAVTAATFASEFGIPTSFGSYEQLFNSPDIDVVYICTPVSTHFQLTTAALQAGKNVLCEKPLTMSAAEARSLAALASERRLLLMEAMWMRFNPAIRRMVEDVESGAIGEVRAVQSGFGIPFPRVAGSRFWEPDLGGGAVLDLGIYPLAFAHLLLGIPDRMHVEGVMLDDGIDVRETTYLAYGDGKFAIAASSLSEFLAPMASVGGSSGAITINESFFSTHTYTLLANPFEAPRVEEFTIEGAGYVPMFRAYGEALARGLLEHPLNPLRFTIEVLAMIDEVRERLSVQTRSRN